MCFYTEHSFWKLGNQETNRKIHFSIEMLVWFLSVQVRRTFSTSSWRDHHETWKEARYDWLPSWKDIPKHLHESLDSKHLQKLKVNSTRTLPFRQNLFVQFCAELFCEICPLSISVWSNDWLIGITKQQIICNYFTHVIATSTSWWNPFIWQFFKIIYLSYHQTNEAHSELIKVSWFPK